MNELNYYSPQAGKWNTASKQYWKKKFGKELAYKKPIKFCDYRHWTLFDITGTNF